MFCQVVEEVEEEESGEEDSCSLGSDSSGCTGILEWDYQARVAVQSQDTLPHQTSGLSCQPNEETCPSQELPCLQTCSSCLPPSTQATEEATYDQTSNEVSPGSSLLPYPESSLEQAISAPSWA